MCRSSFQVYVVVASACANHDLQLFSCVEHFGVYLIATDDDRVCILHGIQQLCLLGVFFQQCQFQAALLDSFTNAIHSNGCKGLLCCNEYLHVSNCLSVYSFVVESRFA